MKQICKKIIRIVTLTALAAIIILPNSGGKAYAATGPNLINNPSVENVNFLNKILPPSMAVPIGWNKNHSVLNSAAFSYPVAGYNSPKAIKVQISTYKRNEEGWFFDRVNISPGTQYIFSDYFISDATTYIEANFKLSNGSTIKTDLAQIQPSSQWTQAQTAFTAPANAVSVTIMHSLRSKGSLTTDVYSLNSNTSPDTTPPVITLNGNPKVTLTVGSTYIDAGATASDNVDGNISSKIITVNPVDTSKIGTYIITYDVSDSAGNKATQVTREVDVIALAPDTTAPQVSITSPTSNDNLSNTILVQATAIDPVITGQISSGIKQVQFYVDDTLFGNPVLVSPYQITLDTTQFPDGTHVLGAIATDNQGNLSAKATVSVSFSNTIIINPNLILNPLLENGTASPTNWSAGQWGNNDAIFTYPVIGYTGNGAKVTINNYTDGDAKWYFDNISVTPGKYYIFSDKYMSTTDTKVIIQFTSANGALSYQEIGNPTASATWQNFQAGFDVPLGVNSLTIFHLLSSVGSLTTDNYSLIQSINPNEFNKGLVTLSFDDGWQTNYDTALPILDAAGLKSTQYIISGSIGDTADGYMTLDELKNIYQKGHEIAAHTRTHVDLTAPDTNLQSEVFGSRSDLLSNFKPVDSIAYPYGLYNTNVQTNATQAGFVGARTVDQGYNDKSTNPFALTVQIVERGGVCGTDHAPTTTLSQVKNWINTAATTNTWLILVFHQTDNNKTNCYGDTPAMLQSIVDYIKTSNVEVVTISQGLHKMNGVPPAGDTISPVISGQADITAKASGSSAIVNFTAPAVTDNIDTGLTAACSSTSGLTSGSMFPIGTTNIICNAADTSGNLAAPVNFKITVSP